MLDWAGLQSWMKRGGFSGNFKEFLQALVHLWLLQGLDPELEVWLFEKADCGVLLEGRGLGCPH